MNVVDYVLENLSPMEILLHYGFREITETDDSIRACCEIHKGNNPSAFVWNKSNNLWFCYTGDCYGGDVFTLIEKMENIDFVAAVKKAAEILALNITGMELIDKRSYIINEQRKWIELQKKKLKIKQSKSDEEYKLPHVNYMSTNNDFSRFVTDTLKYFNAKFCKIYPLPSSMLYNKLVIPIYNENICVGVALRDTTGKFFPKWFYQPEGLKINHYLYNFDNIVKQIEKNHIDEVILVEGIFDVWAYYEIGINNAVAVFGSSLKEEQYKKLLKLAVNITLSFDNDNAGIKCTKQTIKKFKDKVEVKIIQLPMGKDPADCTHDELMTAYLNRT